jgi:hypothetical protein
MTGPRGSIIRKSDHGVVKSSWVWITPALQYVSARIADSVVGAQLHAPITSVAVFPNGLALYLMVKIQIVLVLDVVNTEIVIDKNSTHLLGLSWGDRGVDTPMNFYPYGIGRIGVY